MAAPRSDSDARKSPDRSSNDRDWLRLDSNTTPAESEVATSPSIQLPAIAGYEIIGELARYKSTRLFRAKNVASNQLVTLKVISAAGMSPELRRTQLAIQTGAGGLDHPNLLTVFEARETGSALVIAAEVASEGTLDAWGQRAFLSPHQAAALAADCALGLHRAHQHGHCHGNLTPTCIHLQRNPAATTATTVRSSLLDVTPKVGDYGGAASSPSYLAPERVKDPVAPTPSADVYSVGAILYELLTGRPPFLGQTAVETIQLVQTHLPIPPRRLRPSIPFPLQTICLKCLEKDPHQRYRSAHELALDLRRFLEDQPIDARPQSRWFSRDQVFSNPFLVVTGILVTLIALVIVGQIALRPARNLSGPSGIRNQDPSRDPRLRESQRAMAIHNGIAANSERDPGLAMLHFAAAGRSGAESTDRIDRIRFENWRRSAIQPVAAIDMPIDRVDRVQSWSIHTSGNWLIVTTTLRVRLYDLVAGTELPWPGSNRRNESIRSACWSPDGTLMAVGADRHVRITSFPAGTSAGDIPVDKPAASLAFSPKGDLLAVASDRIRIWDRTANAWRKTDWPANSQVSHVAFAPRGDRLLAAFHSGPAQVFTLDEGNAIEPISVEWLGYETARSHRLPQFPRFVNDGTALATMTRLGQLLVVDVKTGRTLLQSPAVSHAGDALVGFAVSNSDRWVFAAGRHSVVRYDARDSSSKPETIMAAADVWSVSSGGEDAWPCIGTREAALIPDSGHYLTLRHSRPVMGVERIEGNRLITLQDDGLVRVWHGPVSRFHQPWTAIAGKAPVAASIGIDGAYVVVGGTPMLGESPREAVVASMQTGKPLGPPLRPGGMITAMAAAPREKIVALGVLRAADAIERQQRMFAATGNQATVEGWNAVTGKRDWEYAISAEPRAISFSPDGEKLACLTATNEVHMLQSKSGKRIWQRSLSPSRSEPDGPSTSGSICFSPDGAALHTWGLDSNLTAQDAATGQPVHVMQQLGGKFLSVTFSADGKHVITSHESHPVTFWFRDTGQPNSKIVFQNSVGARSVRFSPDGNFLCIAGPEGATTVCRVPGLVPTCSPMHQAGQVIDSFFDAASGLVASVTDRGIQVWDYNDGRPIMPEAPAPARVISATIAHDRAIFLATVDGRVFRIPLREFVGDGRGSWENSELEAQLASSRRQLDNGIVEPLSSKEWLNRWQLWKERPSPAAR